MTDQNFPPISSPRVDDETWRRWEIERASTAIAHAERELELIEWAERWQGVALDALHTARGLNAQVQRLAADQAAPALREAA